MSASENQVSTNMSAAGLRLPGVVSALVLRSVLLALILAALLHLLLATHYYATALVLALCGAWVIADIAAVAARAERTAQRFLEALSCGNLESPPRSLVSGALHGRYESLLGRLRGDRRRGLQQRDYLQTLLDTVPAALLVIDAAGTLTLVNRAAHALLPRPAQRLADLHPGSAASELALLAPGMHRIVRLASGRPLLASAARFATPDGGTRRLICLQRLAGELDAVELQAWDDMARVLTHEMMSSLTPIASLSQSLNALMRRGGPTEEVSAALESITRRSHGLMRFVERYRELADLPPPRLQPLKLCSVVTGVARLIRPAFEQAGVVLQSRVAATDATIAGDPDLLEQALINLLRNALEAVAGQAQPAVEIACGVNETRCFIDICDNGPGLTTLAREQIFVPFFTTKPGGFGVGLSLARRIVAGHGGQVVLQASQGGRSGAVFRVSLPLIDCRTEVREVSDGPRAPAPGR